MQLVTRGKPIRKSELRIADRDDFPSFSMRPPRTQTIFAASSARDFAASCSPNCSAWARQPARAVGRPRDARRCHSRTAVNPNQWCEGNLFNRCAADARRAVTPGELHYTELTLPACDDPIGSRRTARQP
jgi:hypothetical protein